MRGKAIILGIITAYVFSKLFIPAESKNIQSQKRVSFHNKISPAISSVKNEEKIRKIKALQKFFKFYNSSLQDYAEVFIDASENYNLDWRLLPSLAGVESTFAKFTPSCAPFNPFGWTSSTSPCGFWRFESFPEAVEVVARELGEGRTYFEFQKEKTIEKLASIYNPLDNTKRWIEGVYFFYYKLDEFYDSSR